MAEDSSNFDAPAYQPHLNETQSPLPSTNGTTHDVEMLEDEPPVVVKEEAAPEPLPLLTQETPASPSPSLNALQSSEAPTPTLKDRHRTPTPAPSGLTSQLPPGAIIPPLNQHGSPTRVYLNQKITPHLLEAMKYCAANEPEKPLKWLSEFLAQRSREVEGV